MKAVEKVIAIAKGEVGYIEKASNNSLDSKTANPGKNNYTKYARDFDTKYPDFYNGKKNGFEWCDMFVDHCLVSAFGVELALQMIGQPKKSCGAGCKFSASYYKSIGQFFQSPKIGDQIFFKNKSGNICHTGIVYNVGTEYVYTIEGNTSSDQGVIANGGVVAQKKYKLSNGAIAGYGRPKYDLYKEEQPNVDNTPAPHARQAVEWAKKKGIIKGNADGDLMLHSNATREDVLVFMYRNK